jgi:hypothetical protein
MTALAERETMLREALQSQVAAFKRLAASQLPDWISQRMWDLGECKETLTPEEQAELMELVKFSHERTIEKLQAELALKRLREAFPDEVV